MSVFKELCSVIVFVFGLVLMCIICWCCCVSCFAVLFAAVLVLGCVLCFLWCCCAIALDSCGCVVLYVCYFCLSCVLYFLVSECCVFRFSFVLVCFVFRVGVAVWFVLLCLWLFLCVFVVCHVCCGAVVFLLFPFCLFRVCFRV